MTKEQTGVLDKNGKMICAGDVVRCDHPIFTKPKEFLVVWDESQMKYNLPSNADLLRSCEIIQN